ncbi:hypothetical protein, partial [Micromonospora tarensis]|nr:hypothetical protein [Micromonospora tarensis]
RPAPGPSTSPTAAGRDELLVAAFTAWTVPTPWLTHEYGVLDHRVVELLSRLLRAGDLDPVDRCRLLDALTTELDGESDPRGAAAGREALALSRRLDDPELRALGLAARVRTMSYEREAPHRRELALQLRDLADEHGLVSYLSVAEQVLGHCAAALNEPEELRVSVARHGWLTGTYQLHEGQVIHLCALGALAHVAGDFAAARQHYDEVAVQMRRQGSLHAEAFHYFSTGTLLISQGRFGEHPAATRRVRGSLGPIVDDLLALALIESGRVREARAMPIGRHTYRPDYFESALLSVRGMVIVGLGRRDLAQPVIDALLPVREQLAGFSSTAAVLRPVALTLGELFRLLGRGEEAARHFTLAATVGGAGGHRTGWPRRRRHWPTDRRVRGFQAGSKCHRA